MIRWVVALIGTARPRPTPATAVLPDPTMPGAKWFPGATLNYAENVLRMPGIAEDDPALIAYSQSREPITLTARQLREEVRQLVIARNERRLRQGMEPLDVVAEIDRQLRDLTG